MALITQPIRTFFHQPYFYTEEAEETHDRVVGTLLIKAVATVMLKILKASPRISFYSGLYQGAVVVANLYFREGQVRTGWEEGKFFSIACQVVAVVALFFSHGIWISIGIDLLSEGISYLRYQTPSVPQIECVGEKIVIENTEYSAVFLHSERAFQSWNPHQSNHKVPQLMLDQCLNVPTVIFGGRGMDRRDETQLREKGAEIILLASGGEAIEKYKSLVNAGKVVAMFLNPSSGGASVDNFRV